MFAWLGGRALMLRLVVGGLLYNITAVLLFSTLIQVLDKEAFMIYSIFTATCLWFT